MAAFRFTPAAERDLEELIGCIAGDSTDAARRVCADVLDRCAKLARMPEVGRPRPELGAGIRSFPVAPCLVYYRPVPGGIEVIIRVLHAARDVDAAF